VNFSSYSGTDVVFTNNEVYSNTAQGGAGIHMANVSSSLVFTNNIIRDNYVSGSGCGGGVKITTGACNMNGNQITGNTAGYGAGIYIAANTGTISDNTISGNIASSIGGGLYTTTTGGVITDNIIADNEANNAGGIYTGAGSSSPPCEISRNTISGNHASADGGGIYTYTGTPNIYGNVISGNEAGNAGNGVYLNGFNVFANNTIVNNTYSSTIPCGIYLPSATNIYLYNNIIVNNSTYGIYTNSGSYYSYNNCYYGNGSDYNIAPTGSSSDVFSNPTLAADGYHLALGSPCINAGNDTIVQSGWLDIDGEARQSATAVDIGADEAYWVENPVINPNGGSYDAPKPVELTCTTTGASIRYTLDGSDPIITSAEYTGSLSLETSCTVKVRAFKTDYLASDIVSAAFIIIDTAAPFPGILDAPQYANTTSFNVTYTGARDIGDSGLKTVELWYKYGVFGTWTYTNMSRTTGSGSFTFTPAGGVGVYYFALVAEDNNDLRSADASGEGQDSTIYLYNLDACSVAAIIIPPMP